LSFEDSTYLGELDLSAAKSFCYWNSTKEPNCLYTYPSKEYSRTGRLYNPQKWNEHLDFTRKINAFKPDMIITFFPLNKIVIYIFLKDHQIYVDDNADPKDYSIQKIIPLDEYKKLHPSSYKEDLFTIYYNSLEEFYFPTKTKKSDNNN